MTDQALIARPQSYEEMATREGFRDVLDRGLHALDRILTDYSFAKLCKCGLSGCRQPHKLGFLARTVDGLETNVGHVCGKHLFGADVFEKARAAYEHNRELEQLHQRATQIRAEAPTIRQRIAALETARFGADWIVKVRAALHRALGGDFFESLRVAQLRGDLQVTEHRQRTRAEVDRIVEMTRQKREQVQVETRLLGTLVRMPWITFDFGALRSRFDEPLVSFHFRDLSDLDLPAFRREVKKFDGMQDAIIEAEQTCMAARSFFDPSNLALLVLWVPAQRARNRRAIEEWVRSAECAQLADGLNPAS